MAVVLDRGRYALAFVLAAALAAGIVWVSALPAFSFIGWIAVLIATAVFCVWWSIKRTGDAFSPLTLTAIFYVLTFVGGAIYFWFVPMLPGFNSAFLGDRDELPRAVELGAIAFALFTVGYMAHPFRRVAPFLPRVPRFDGVRSIWPILAIILAIGWLGRLMLLASGRYFHTTATEVANTGASWFTISASALPLLATAFAGAYSYLGPDPAMRKKARRAFLVLLAVEFAWAAPTGERGMMVGLALMLASLHYYGSGRFPWKPLVAASLFLTFIVFPFVAEYRKTGYQHNPGQHVAAAQQRTLSAQSTGGLLTQGFDATFSRFSGVTSIAIMTGSNRKFFTREPGETLKWIPEAAVPRALVPEKEDPALYGNEFGRSHASISSRDYITAITPLQFGELYLNFGLIGIILGMPIVGAVYRLYGDFLRDRRNTPMVLALYAVLAWPIISAHEAILAVGVVGMAKVIALDLLVLLLVSRLAPSLEAPGGARAPRAAPSLVSR